MLTTVYKDESGAVSAVKLASETPEEAQELMGAAEHYKAETAESALPPPVEEDDLPNDGAGIPPVAGTTDPVEPAPEPPAEPTV